MLVTSIGSFSTEAVVKSLKKMGYTLTGCDIYPKEWHYISKKFKEVYQVNLAKNSYEYIDDILKICMKENIKYILPSTDIEIDVINKNRKRFKEVGIILCIQDEKVLEIVRDKYKLYEFFEFNNKINSIETYKVEAEKDIKNFIDFPYIAKPRDGRSSEGVVKIFNEKDFFKIDRFNNYIIQKLILGNIITVDYIRCRESNTDFSIAREELLRTKNGAGTTIKIRDSEQIKKIVSKIGEKLDINGCICMEFIENKGEYYLIDVNPRFSAGIAFSQKMSYDFIKNHINCFKGEKIDKEIRISEKIIVKHYIEDFV